MKSFSKRLSELFQHAAEFGWYDEERKEAFESEIDETYPKTYRGSFEADEETIKWSLLKDGRIKLTGPNWFDLPLSYWIVMPAPLYDLQHPQLFANLEEALEFVSEWGNEEDC